MEKVEDVHREILRDAAAIANQKLTTDVNFSTTLMGEVFRPDPIRSNKGGLCLSLEEQVRSLDPEQIQVLHQIGAQAIRQALLRNKEKFVGLILGDARQGRNYFDRF
jgi:hypothetical protein